MKNKKDKERKSIIKSVFRFIYIVIALVFVSAVIIAAVLKVTTYYSVHIGDRSGVDEGLYAEIGDIDQYLLIRGKNAANPVIIFLHSGPGSPDAYVSYTYTKYLTDDYTVICWDQRGCGRTYFANEDKENDTATFERALTDLDELVDYARERFNKEKVYIIGHSYGTMLGSKYALTHHEKIEAYIGIGQVVNCIKAEKYSYNDALLKAIKNGDDTASMEKAFADFEKEPSVVNIMKLRDTESRYHSSDKRSNELLTMIKSPYMGINDIRWLFKQLGSLEKYEELNAKLFDQLIKTDINDFGTEYRIPVGFISGSLDWTTPTELSKEYYENITAPYKSFITIDGGGHSPQTDDPEEFCKKLKNMINILGE